VRDAGGSPVPGVAVTFTAPGSGASGVFGGSLAVTVTTDASGVATAPPFTANGTAGSYTMTASISAGFATFSLTNNRGASASITAIAGTPQPASVGTALAPTLLAEVRDAGGTPVPGVVVTFSARASGASGGFGGSLAVTVTTDASGVATAPAFTANG